MPLLLLVLLALAASPSLAQSSVEVTVTFEVRPIAELTDTEVSAIQKGTRPGEFYQDVTLLVWANCPWVLEAHGADAQWSRPEEGTQGSLSALPEQWSKLAEGDLGEKLPVRFRLSWKADASTAPTAPSLEYRVTPRS